MGCSLGSRVHQKQLLLILLVYPRNTVSASYVPDAIFCTETCPGPNLGVKSPSGERKRRPSTGQAILHVRLTQKFSTQPHSGP